MQRSGPELFAIEPQLSRTEIQGIPLTAAGAPMVEGALFVGMRLGLGTAHRARKQIDLWQGLGALRRVRQLSPLFRLGVLLLSDTPFPFFLLILLFLLRHQLLFLVGGSIVASVIAGPAAYKTVRAGGRALRFAEGRKLLALPS